MTDIDGLPSKRLRNHHSFSPNGLTDEDRERLFSGAAVFLPIVAELALSMPEKRKKSGTNAVISSTDVTALKASDGAS